MLWSVSCSHPTMLQMVTGTIWPIMTAYVGISQNSATIRQCTPYRGPPHFPTLLSAIHPQDRLGMYRKLPKPPHAQLASSALTGSPCLPSIMLYNVYTTPTSISVSTFLSIEEHKCKDRTSKTGKKVAYCKGLQATEFTSQHTQLNKYHDDMTVFLPAFLQL